MTRILLIETSTALCSVALAEDGRIVATRESAEPRVHAAMTAPYVKEVLGDRSVRDLDAVCVGKGPGSYTGLRVGVSAAKGLCFGAGIPLLSVGTLDTLVYQARAEGLLPEGCRYVVPMIDARRMEVYSAVFTPDARQIRETKPEIIDASSFADLLSEGPVLFIGDGVDKCREVLASPRACFAPCAPKAASMAVPAFAAFREGRFEDVAYFEPFYLKEFVATVPRRNLFSALGK